MAGKDLQASNLTRPGYALIGDGDVSLPWWLCRNIVLRCSFEGTRCGGSLPLKYESSNLMLELFVALAKVELVRAKEVFRSLLPFHTMTNGWYPIQIALILIHNR